MKCGNCGVKAMAGGIAMLNTEKDQWRCPACKAWNVIKEENTVEQSELNDGLSCDCCGGKMVYIRGRHLGMDNRLVCPTCMAETLDDIKERLRTNYGQAEQGAR